MGDFCAAIDFGMQRSTWRIMEYRPLKLQPCYKEYLWGGERLKKEYGKNDAPKVTAESWELAAHPDGMSVVAEGDFKGKTLLELGKIDRKGFWGDDCAYAETFPIMVKLIDAAKDLSIQVHPSDATANKDKGESGKAEMWYIVDCKPQSSIYLGLSKSIMESEFLRRSKEGSICEVLNKVPVKKGDVFYILPGTIHAIGAGIVIAEIQQNSNTTFRVYDYNRKDVDGNLRPLHLERAAQVMNYEPIIPGECRANGVATFPGFSITEMFSCSYFRAYKADVETEAKLVCDRASFQHLLCVSGEGDIISGKETCRVRTGESFFMPAAIGEYRVRGKCRILISKVWREER